jgi:hypothetical protein
VDGTGWVLVGIIHEILKYMIFISVSAFFRMRQECWASSTTAGGAPHHHRQSFLHDDADVTSTTLFLFVLSP